MQATHLATVVHDDTQFLYATTSTETPHIVIGASAFEVDDAWSKTYRTDGGGTTDAVSTTYMGDQDFVVFQINRRFELRSLVDRLLWSCARNAPCSENWLRFDVVRTN